MLGWIAVGAVRSAARAGSKPQGQKPVEWQPFTKLVWFFFIFAIPIAIGGGWRVASFVILGLIAASVIIVLAVCIVQAATKRNDKPPADPLADYFSDKGAKQ